MRENATRFRCTGGGSVESLFSVIERASLEDVYRAVTKLEETELVSASNVPQFSKLDSAFRVPEVLSALHEAQTFEALGLYLDFAPNKKVSANKKYGENHAKLATLLDLAEITSTPIMRVSETCFGNLFCNLSDERKWSVAARLAFRIPVVQRILIDAAVGEVEIADYLKPFSESTKKRRVPNIRSLFNLIGSQAAGEDINLKNALRNVR